MVVICLRDFKYPVWLEYRKGSSGNETGEVIGNFFCEQP